MSNKFIGNKNNNSFHSENCQFAPKSPDKRVEFVSAEEALEKGFKPCHSCNPINKADNKSMIIGNKNNKSYHLPTCQYAPRAADKKVEFINVEEAAKEGYKPCSTCNPNKESAENTLLPDELPF